MRASILIMDLETSPNLAHVWNFWRENIGAKQVLQDGEILSFAAKWLGSDKVIYEENRKRNDKTLVKKLLKLINKADLVVAHNGKRFDMGWFRAKAAIHRLSPPSPVKIVDTMIVSKNQFFFPSNSLEYLARVFDCGEKLPHKKYPGHELWLECLKNNNEAWKEMKKYNIQDVTVLEDLYLKMRPWIPNHPNIGVYEESDKPLCPKCGSDNIHFRGYSYTTVGKYRQFQCQENYCGGWGRLRYNEYNKDKRSSLGTNAR